MLKSMKGVKLSGLTDNIAKVVAKLRAKEISTAFKFRVALLSIIVIGKYFSVISCLLWMLTSIGQSIHTTNFGTTAHLWRVRGQGKFLCTWIREAVLISAHTQIDHTAFEYRLPSVTDTRGCNSLS